MKASSKDYVTNNKHKLKEQHKKESELLNTRSDRRYYNEKNKGLGKKAWEDKLEHLRRINHE